jgi:hypothetical protein
VEFLLSVRQLLLGVAHKLYFLLPALILVPIDLIDRLFGLAYSPPTLLSWALSILGLLLAIALTYHELRVQAIAAATRSSLSVPFAELFRRVPAWQPAKQISWRAARKTITNGRRFIEQYKLTHGLDEKGLPRLPQGDSVDAEVARSLWMDSEQNVSMLERFIEQAFGSTYHWDKSDEERLEFYMLKPPITENAKITKDGKTAPLWESMSRELPSDFARMVIDYLGLLQKKTTL